MLSGCSLQLVAAALLWIMPSLTHADSHIGGHDRAGYKLEFSSEKDDQGNSSQSAAAGWSGNAFVYDNFDGDSRDGGMILDIGANAEAGGAANGDKAGDSSASAFVLLDGHVGVGKVGTRQGTHLPRRVYVLGGAVLHIRAHFTGDAPFDSGRAGLYGETGIILPLRAHLLVVAGLRGGAEAGYTAYGQDLALVGGGRLLVTDAKDGRYSVAAEYKRTLLATRGIADAKIEADVRFAKHAWAVAGVEWEKDSIGDETRVVVDPSATEATATKVQVGALVLF